ncbi:MAG TPA: hypothetical protein VHU88_02415 [Sporichthyaceae bacterium]|jgi:hypothetical protein|nr:hypothetical protein [Sporichthyaceae bacterium]
MCHAVQCRTCGKIGWTGCGEHIEEALAGVPDEQRCPGHNPVPGRGLRGLFNRR